MRKKILSIAIAVILVIGLIVSIWFNISLHNENKKLIGYQDKFDSCTTELAAAYEDASILQNASVEKDEQIEVLEEQVSNLQKQVETLKKK